MKKYNVSHATTYRYTEPVILGHNHAHLSPRNFFRQHCESYLLNIVPRPNAQSTWTDFFGNEVTYFTLEEGHHELSVTARSIVCVHEPQHPLASATEPWEVIRDKVATGTQPDSLAASQFTFESHLVRRLPESAAYAAESFRPGRPLLEATLELTNRIFRDFKFDATATAVNTPTSEVFKKRRGVCQDFAHLQISCLRSLRLPARYVSGYLQTEAPLGQKKMIGADASHAWVSVFFPGLGWIDFDPTNNQIPSVRHVTVAWGRDYSDVCPVKGVFIGGGTQSINVAVDVAPISEDINYL